MKKLTAVLAALVLAAGTASAFAQQTKPPAEEKKMDKADKKGDAATKPATKSATGTVKSVSPDSIVVAGKEKGKDAEWTFAVDTKTKVKKEGKDVAAPDLKAGDAVQVRYTEQGGKSVAQSITVRADKAEKKPTNPCAAKK